MASELSDLKKSTKKKLRKKSKNGERPKAPLCRDGTCITTVRSSPASRVPPQEQHPKKTHKVNSGATTTIQRGR